MKRLTVAGLVAAALVASSAFSRAEAQEVGWNGGAPGGGVVAEGGGGIPEGGGGDSIAPAKITGVTASPAGPDAVYLEWTATGDDGLVGTASLHDLRYSTVLIMGETGFNAATPATGEPVPAASGTLQGMTVAGLLPDTMYHFAIKARDESGNWSPMSDVASAVTGSVPDPSPSPDPDPVDSPGGGGGGGGCGGSAGAGQAAGPAALAAAFSLLSPILPRRGNVG